MKTSYPKSESQLAVSRVPRDTGNPAGMSGDHSVRLNTTQWPIEHSTVKERWKEPRERSEREPETICLQAVEALYMCNRVLFVERSGELRWLARLSHQVTEPKRNQVLIGRISQSEYTRNRVTYPCPGWSCRKRQWRSEHTSVEKGGDEVWIAEKFQSNPEIAGSPRNSFRASLETV